METSLAVEASGEGEIEIFGSERSVRGDPPFENRGFRASSSLMACVFLKILSLRFDF